MKATTTLFLLLLCSILGHGQATYKASKTATGYELATVASIDTADAPKDALGGTIKAQSTIIVLPDSTQASDYLLNALTKLADQIAQTKQQELALERDHAALSKEYNTLFGANAYERALYRLMRENIGNTVTIRENGVRVGVFDLEKPNGQSFSFNIREGSTSRGRLAILSAGLWELRNWNGARPIQLYADLQNLTAKGEYTNDQGKIVRIRLVSTRPPANTPPPVTVPGPGGQRN